MRVFLLAHINRHVVKVFNAFVLFRDRNSSYEMKQKAMYVSAFWCCHSVYFCSIHVACDWNLHSTLPHLLTNARLMMIIEIPIDSIQINTTNSKVHSWILFCCSLKPNASLPFDWRCHSKITDPVVSFFGYFHSTFPLRSFFINLCKHTFTNFLLKTQNIN